MLRRVVPLAVVLLALTAAPAHAVCEQVRWETRWQPDMTGATGGSLVHVPVCQDRRSPKPRATQPKGAKQPTKAQYRELRYVPSEAVSATVRERMIEQLAYGDQAEQIKAQIGSGDLMNQFNTVLRKAHWRPDDFGDVYSQAYISLWMAANDVQVVSRRTDTAVRRELRRQLALDKRVRGLADAVQQEQGEYLASWTVVILGSINNLRRGGDSAALKAFQDHARELIRAPDLLGLDLTQVTLSPKGIARRRG